MAQKVDIGYRDKARSETLNQRFKDITGPSVARGFRLALGTNNFTVSLTKAEYTSSVAVTPSGVRIEETTDLIDIVSVEPNTETSGSPRIDSVYLVYQFGPNATGGKYVVVKGGSVAAPNPNNTTHLLLGYVSVRPNNYPLQASDLKSVEYGFSNLKVAGVSDFFGKGTFHKEVTFKGPVTFMDGTSGGGGGSGSAGTMIKRLSAPIISSAGQQDVTLPSAYSMNSNSLFVFLDGKQCDPTDYIESSTTTFRFHDPLEAKQEIWAFWFEGVNLFKPSDHNHDDLYYRKWEIADRSVRYLTDYFNGTSGRTLKHYLGHTNYVLLAVTPVEKTADVGVISAEKRDEEIIVYNSGSYKGKFDLTYMLKPDYVYTPTNEDMGFYNIAASQQDTAKNVYQVVDYKRKDGTIYMKSTLSTTNAAGQYTRLKNDYYNTTGTLVVKTVTWALNYDARGFATSKTIV